MKMIATLVLGAVAADVTKLASFDGTKSLTYKWQPQNDPVMGGASTSSFVVADNTGVFNGTCAIVPFLKAPGFAKIATVSGSGPAFPDVSSFLDGGITMRIRSSTPDYPGYKVGFVAKDVPARKYGPGGFKADFALEGSDWQVVTVPFKSFSYDWSPFTGECDTKDPDGTQHYCCSEEHLEVCPSKTFLSTLTNLEVWAEGKEGDFHIEIDYIGVSAAPSVTARPTDGNDLCSAPVQEKLLYGISGRTTATVPVAVDEGESLATAVCCDKRVLALAEPQFLYAAPDILLFDALDKNTGVTTFYDSVCGLPLFRTPVNRTMDEFKADTDEHGWPSFRTAEVVFDNVDTDKATGYVTSKCGTHLGSYLPDEKGPRWCIDLSCVAGVAV